MFKNASNLKVLKEIENSDTCSKLYGSVFSKVVFVIHNMHKLVVS